MKIRYFAYHLEEPHTGEKHRVSLLKFFKAYCGYDNSDFKSRFMHNEEKTFLLHVKDNLFLFAKAKQTELVKAIDLKKNSSADIADRLMADESLGFASYVSIHDTHVAFASTMLAPTISCFETFVAQILLAVGCKTHRFVLRPFTETVSKADALEMKFISTTSIKVPQKSTLYAGLKELFGGDEGDFAEVGAFEIILRPKTRKDIKPLSKRLINDYADQAERVTIRAKEELTDRLTDFQIDGLGVLHDIVVPKAKQPLEEAILELIAANAKVVAKAAEYEKDNGYTAAAVGNLGELDTTNGWIGRLGPV